MYLIVQVFCLDIALCFIQFRTLRLMRSVGDIFRDDEAFHIIMKPDAVCGGLSDGG